MGLFTKLFGTRSEREIKKIKTLADQIVALEPEYRALFPAAFEKHLNIREAVAIFLPRSYNKENAGGIASWNSIAAF